jgi:hypothetical protein
MPSGAGGEYDSRQKVGIPEHCHPHHPWDSLAWPQYKVLYRNMVIEFEKHITLHMLDINIFNHEARNNTHFTETDTEQNSLSFISSGNCL